MQQKWFKSMLAAVAVTATSVIGQSAFGDEVKIVEEAALVAECGTEKELYFENRKLTDVQDLAMTCKQGFGGSTDERDYRWSEPKVASGTFMDSGLYLLSNDGAVLTVEFHGRTYGNSYDGVGNGFLLQLTQEGDDIYGQVMWAAGFTGANTLGFDVTWESKKGKISDYYNTTALYHSFGRNLRLYFSDAATQERTVYFMGKDSELIKTYVVPVGEYAAVAPTADEMPDYGDNWVFLGWDKPFDNVQKIELMVNALYHKLCTVTFMGGLDGQTMISQQTVEQTCAAEAPEVPAIPNYVFLNWDKDFSDIEDDLVVTAVYARTYEVVFKNPDGTVIDTQTVRTGLAATAPDMTGAEYKGVPFFGWEGDFSCVTSDLEIIAFYGLRPNFDKSFSVTIPANYSDGSCSTYPILLRLSENNIVGFDYDDFKRAGKDIYVTDAAGNQLPIELAVWNPAGESLLYVQVSSELEGTAITVSYGSSQTFDQPAGMWAGYAGVWHFEEADGYAADSTGHGLTATPHGVTEQMIASDDAVIGRSRVNATATDTKNGMGVSADINNYITDASVFTVEGWFKATSVNGYTRVFSRKNSYSDAKGFEIEYDSGSKTTGKVTGKGGSPRLNFTTAETTADWQKLTFVINGGIASVYTNGALSASGEIAAVEAASVGFSIGNDADFNERQWWGMFDEVKFYNGAKNAAQIAFEYALEAGTAEALVYGHVKSTDTSKPDVSSVKITSEDGETMNISVGLSTLGDGADSAVAYIAYGPDAEHLSEPVKFAEGTDSPLVGVVSNLDACVTYAYSIYVENGLGKVSDVKAGSFRVAAATIPVDDPLSCAGLMQAKLNNANDFTTTSPDFLQNSVIPPEVVPGVVMALYKVDSGKENSVFYTSPYTGHEFKWNGSNTTFGYFGEIYLPAGELHIGKNIDDSAYVKIGDTVVLENTQHDAFPVGTFRVESAGWYPLEIRIGDGSGGKGITNTAKFENNGIAYNIDGTTDPAKTGWAPLMDTQGGLLRVLVGDDTYLALGPVSATDDGAVSAWISVDHGLPAAAKLVAVYAPEDKGAISSAWNSRIVLAELAEGETMVSTKFTLPNLAKYGAVRFALLADATETSPAFSQFSKLYEYEQILPLVALKVGEIAEEGISVTMPVEAFGAGAESATLRLEYSFTDDFAQSEFIEIGACTELKNVNFNITTLAPATTYFMRAVLVNSKGESNVSEAVQFTTYNSAVAHPGETLVWNGGETGTWDDSTANWISPKGHQVVWLDGCKARFDGKATVTLSAPHSVLGFEVGADVTLKGEAITLMAPATVTRIDGCTFRFECDVKGEAGICLENVNTPNYLPSGEGSAVVVFKDTALDDIDTSVIKAAIRYNRGGSEAKLLYVGLIDDGVGKNGISYFKSGDGWMSFECRIIIGDWYNNPYIAKVVLKQVGNDIYGYVEKAEALESISNTVSIEVTGGQHHPITVATSELVIGTGAPTYQLAVEGVILTDRDPKWNAATEIAGDYQATGEIKVNMGKFKVVDGGTMFGGHCDGGIGQTSPILIADNGFFEFDSTAEQVFATSINGTSTGNSYLDTHKRSDLNGRFVIGSKARNVTFTCSSEGMHRFYGPIDIYGTVTISKGTYHLVHGNSYGIFVHDGGVLNMNSFLGGYGLREAIITCEKGGTINCPDVWSLGSGDAGKPLTVDGGVVNMSYDYDAKTGDDIKQTALILKNGALVDGVMMTWGRGENTLTVGGTEPSTVALERIRFGQNANASSTKMVETLVVNDVTGDEAEDLVVSSKFYLNPAAKWSLDNVARIGFVKDGAGTLLLTGASTDFGGSVAMKAGTLKLGKGARLDGAVLIVSGDSTIDCAGGAMAFADSHEIAWTDGATLNLTGEIGRKSIRVGTDANGLTPDQLAAITVNGKKGRVAIGGDGYLIVSSGMMVIVK